MASKALLSRGRVSFLSGRNFLSIKEPKRRMRGAKELNYIGEWIDPIVAFLALLHFVLEVAFSSSLSPSGERLYPSVTKEPCRFATVAFMRQPNPA